MPAFTPITSWTQADVLHFARRAGIGITPELAATLASIAPGTVIDRWIDGLDLLTGGPLDSSLYEGILSSRADVVETPKVAGDPTMGGVDVPAVPGPHPFLHGAGDPTNAWRNALEAGQAYVLFGMQFNPYSFQERLAIFWHNLWATSVTKVANTAAMVNQYDLFKSYVSGNFADMIVSVSQDPAMLVWLDSVLNNAYGGGVPNENYAREVMELYTLGVDNGYDQSDITNLAIALSGWGFTFSDAEKSTSPADGSSVYAQGHFALYNGSTNPAGPTGWYNLGDNLGVQGSTLPRAHGSGTIDYLGATYPVVTLDQCVTALRSITTSRASNCASFLASRLLLHFVTPDFSAFEVLNLQNQILADGFAVAETLRALLKSTYFFAPDKRYALAEGPTTWIARAARMLCPDLATGDAPPASYAPVLNSGKAFPAWRLLCDTRGSTLLGNMGMSLLNASGPNGWKEDKAWLNSNTIRFRGMFAASLALLESSRIYENGTDQTYALFPTDSTTWFTTVPATATDVFNRLVDLLQPAPIPVSVSAKWLTDLFGYPAAAISNFASQSTQVLVRQLAYQILCSPAGQLY